MITFEAVIEADGGVKITKIETDEQQAVVSSKLVVDQPAKFIQGDSEQWADEMIAHLEEGEANSGMEVADQPLPPEEAELTITYPDPEPTE